MFLIIFASTNEGKLKELRETLNSSFIELRSVGDYLNNFNPEENGSSFYENAFIKAKAASEELSKLNDPDLNSQALILSDDSGLEIEALGGRPGIYSGRYLKSPEGGIEAILKEMQGKENRSARFLCSMVLMNLNGELLFRTENYWNGNISLEPRGLNGFGYDPIVIPLDQTEKTVAELGSEIKNKISHRAQALEALIQFLIE